MLVASVTGALVDWTARTVGDHGAYAVFLLMLLESACIPVPSEVIMLFAGYLVTLHKLNFVVAVAAGSLGNVAGSWVAWAVGAYGGHAVIERYGRYVHVTPARLALAERWFDRYGHRVVFWSRILPIVRTFISLPAGIARMQFGRFTLYTLLGSIPWCIFLTAIGVAVGSNWKHWEERLKFLDYAIAAGIVAGIVYLVVRARRSPPTPTPG